MPKVTVHRQWQTQIVTPDGDLQDVIAVTYSTDLLPPRTIFVPRPEATDQRIRQAIRQDLEAQLQQRPTALEV